MVHDSERAALYDRTLIRERLELYMSALDRLDRQLVIECFTEDAELEYDLKPERYVGGAHFFETLSRVFSAFSSTNHSISNSHVVVSGDTARVDSRAIAVLVDKHSQRTSIRGVRYLDDLVRCGADWKIKRRIHQPLWQYDVDGAACVLPGLDK